MLITVSGKYEVNGAYFNAFPVAAEDQTLFIIDLPQGVYAGKSVVVQL